MSGLQELVDGMMGSTVELPEYLKAKLKTRLNEQFGEKAMKSMFEQLIYPKEPVEIGESWKTRQLGSLDFPTIATIVDKTLTLKEVKNKVAMIAVNSTVQSDPNAKPDQIGRTIMMRYQLAGRQQGNMTVRLSDGMISRSKWQQLLTGKMFVTTVLAGQPIETSSPAEIETTILIEQNRLNKQ
jgi:Family of unknown function (DUF6263)